MLLVISTSMGRNKRPTKHAIITLLFFGVYVKINCMERKDLQKNKSEMQNELLPEYDLKKLRVRGVGPGRKSFAGKPIIKLEPDVSEVFPDTAAVNEALRFLIRVTKENNAATK